MEFQDFCNIHDIVRKVNEVLKENNVELVINDDDYKVEISDKKSNRLGQTKVTKIISYCTARDLNWYFKAEENTIKLVIF